MYALASDFEFKADFVWNNNFCISKHDHNPTLTSLVAGVIVAEGLSIDGISAGVETIKNTK